MSGSSFQGVLEIIPQISYDIVGRIIPGTMIILSLTFAILGPTQTWDLLDKTLIRADPAPNGWAVGLFLLIAYTLAFTIDGIWEIPRCLRRRGEAPCNPDPDHPSASLKFDTINQELPKAGSWFTKLYAETNMTHVLTLGWIISAVINLALLLRSFAPGRVWLEVGFIMGIAGATTAGSSITNTREDSLRNLWTFLQKRYTTSIMKEDSNKTQHTI